MPNTTNFNFPTPADTDLVKDGALAIRDLGNSIDTAFVDLKGGTTGQFLSKNSNTDLDFVFATPVSGGMTLINTGGTTLTGASVTIGSIPGTFNYLKLIVENFLPATDNNFLSLRINGDTNANRHKNQVVIEGDAQSFDETVWNITKGGDNASSQMISVLDIYGYANTTTWKMGQCTILQNNHTTATNYNFGLRQFGYNQTAAVTSLVLFPNTGNFTSGTAYLYGVK
jgi:hypothetical protein